MSGFGKASVRDAAVEGHTVLVRADLNVPLEGGAVADDTRIRAAMPTIEYLRQHGARIILCTHLGRPDGKVIESLRLRPVAERLAEVMGAPVATAPDCVGPEAERAAAAL